MTATVCHLAFGGTEFVPSDTRFISTGCRAGEKSAEFIKEVQSFLE